MTRSCRRRPCASLPRRRASAAEVAALEAQVKAARFTSGLALNRANALGAVLAAPFESGGQRSAHLTLHQGGAA